MVFLPIPNGNLYPLELQYAYLLSFARSVVCLKKKKKNVSWPQLVFSIACFSLLRIYPYSLQRASYVIISLLRIYICIQCLKSAPMSYRNKVNTTATHQVVRMTGLMSPPKRWTRQLVSYSPFNQTQRNPVL